ncbi:hypothetical protein OJ252_1342 [Cryptosporidium canis]|uniref:Uncharacterized protein n=1 Tax=Cryptosporidium canis TaxID=195482 RepID=A0ABQ8P8J6_9CRYT|nr:hypothetical protein OJ252_1342 [Cryptosporidium canis]
MGASESTCSLNPAINNKLCTANHVQIQSNNTNIYDNYLLSASNSITNNEVTYTFDCKIREELLFGKIYCNAAKSQIVISCGNESHEISTQPLKKLLDALRSPCSFVFDFYSSGISLYSIRGKANVFSTNKFTAAPKEIKTEKSGKIAWRLKEREEFDTEVSIPTSPKSKDDDHLEIKQRLNYNLEDDHSVLKSQLRIAICPETAANRHAVSSDVFNSGS